MNFAGRGFDLAAHQARIAAWHPPAYPGVDIYLPICGEPIELLRNTWTAVSALIAAYQGRARAYVLDDGPDERGPLDGRVVRLLLYPPARLAGRQEERQPALRLRPDRGEYLVILDADFAPRPRFPGRDPALHGRSGDRDRADAAVSSGPARRRPGSSTRPAPIQEVFYRTVQVARHRLDAAVCCGTSAVYRRAALEPQGGPTLIPYAEDVHTGLDVRRAGWSMVYLPVVLSTGICPDNLDAFVRQQYRWCSGNVGIVFSRRLWSIPMRAPGPAGLRLRVLLLRLHRADHLLRAAHPRRHAGLPARRRSGCGTSSSCSRPC